MGVLGSLIEAISPKTARRLEEQEMDRRRPFQPKIDTGNYPGREGDTVNPSRNGAQPGDPLTTNVHGVVASRNADPNQP